MENIRSKLTEKATLLETNDKLNGTTIARFKDSLETRAAIRPVSSFEASSLETFEVVMPKPPPGFGKINFSGLKWRDEFYVFKSPLKLIKGKFLKGIIAKF